MPLRITAQEFRLLSDFIEAECGVLLGNEKAYLIENRLSNLAKASGCRTFGEFYVKLKHSSRSDRIRSAVTDAITTHETLWFRDGYPFRVLQESLLPEFQKDIRAETRDSVRIWSAACSTGQEPYSIAITALDFYLKTGIGAESCHSQVAVLATDVSEKVLSAARTGRYDINAVSRGLLPGHLERHFRKEGNEWVLEPKIKKMVTFRQMNLKEPISSNIGYFDIIFLRNVIIYFSEEFKKILFARAARLMNRGGYLFLGAGETVGGYSDAFDIIEYEGMIFYRIKS